MSGFRIVVHVEESPCCAIQSLLPAGGEALVHREGPLIPLGTLLYLQHLSQLFRVFHRLLPLFLDLESHFLQVFFAFHQCCLLLGQFEFPLLNFLLVALFFLLPLLFLSKQHFLLPLLSLLPLSLPLFLHLQLYLQLSNLFSTVIYSVGYSNALRRVLRLLVSRQNWFNLI